MKPILLSALLLLSVPAAAGSHFYAGAQERYSAQAGEIVTPDTGEVHRWVPGWCSRWPYWSNSERCQVFSSIPSVWWESWGGWPTPWYYFSPCTVGWYEPGVGERP